MIQIIADTTSSLPVELAQSMGIAYLPQIIMFGEQSFRDDTELDPATFIQRLKASAELPENCGPASGTVQPDLPNTC